MSWTGHWHGFGPWVGSGREYAQEGQRRPGAVAGLATETFLRDKRPPMMTGWWLMRRGQVAATWEDDPRPAVAWLEQQYAAHPPMTREDGRQAYASLEWKRAYALDQLPRGRDITWGYWTSAGSLASFSVVSCPNRFHPDLPCPVAAQRPAVAAAS
ncbi:hypothetical protein AB0N20_22465 [Streptomyces griseoincarnatus]